MMGLIFPSVPWTGSNKTTISTAKFTRNQSLHPNWSWYLLFYSGHSPLRILCGNVRQIRSNWRKRYALEVEERKASLVELELATWRMHDILEQDGIPLFSMPAFPQQQTSVLWINQRRSGSIWNRIRSVNLHADVLIFILIFTSVIVYSQRIQIYTQITIRHPANMSFCR